MKYSANKLTGESIARNYQYYLLQLNPDEFTFFHLTTTYQPYQSRIYTAKDVNRFFINFYLKNLLPDLFLTRTWTRAKKAKQPIVLAFLDEHQPHLVKDGTYPDGSPIYAPTARLHHHSIIASRPATTEKFRVMCGTNTMLRYSAKMMSSDLKECDPHRLGYASKMLWKYPEDYLFFGFFD